MVKELILDILFPRYCVGCGKEGKYICDKCQIFVSEAMPIYHKLPCLDGLTSVWDYEGLIKELIHKIKYQGMFHIIKELSSLKDIEVYYKYITYVPMHKKRKKKRGFNQAEIIAKELSSFNNAKKVDLIKKIKNTKVQTELTKEQRIENVKDCFKFVGAGSSRPRNVILVDDVFTTGATMNECCKVLKQSGIKKVWGFTLARTV